MQVQMQITATAVKDVEEELYFNQIPLLTLSEEVLSLLIYFIPHLERPAVVYFNSNSPTAALGLWCLFVPSFSPAVSVLYLGDGHTGFPFTTPVHISQFR